MFYFTRSLLKYVTFDFCLLLHFWLLSQINFFSVNITCIISFSTFPLWVTVWSENWHPSFPFVNRQEHGLSFSMIECWYYEYLNRSKSEGLPFTTWKFSLRMFRVSKLDCRVYCLQWMEGTTFIVWSLETLDYYYFPNCMKYFITWKCVWQFSQKSIWQTAHNFQNTFLQVLTFVFVSKRKLLRLNLVSLKIS